MAPPTAMQLDLLIKPSGRTAILTASGFVLDLANPDATGLPVLYNTSFNLFGEPLVCTPRDAVRSFWSSGIDAMVAGNFLLEK